MCSPLDLRWVKASFSANLGACVELAQDGEMILLRDSKVPDMHLRLSRVEVLALIESVKRGRLDHLVEKVGTFSISTSPALVDGVASESFCEDISSRREILRIGGT